MIRFRDADTGHFVSRQTWLRQLRHPTRDIIVEEFERRAPGQGQLFTQEQLAQPGSAERRAAELAELRGAERESTGGSPAPPPSDDDFKPSPRQSELANLDYSEPEDSSHLDFDDEDIYP